ncbi:MAG: hypothetical protein B7X40_07205 [Cellulomonas sp. 14-74-6]|nr:MAG: hypothetical protein B7X40_07205 [Cellulomonas sp. 14-74-6]
MSTNGDVAMTVEAGLVCSRCDATYTSTKNTLVLSRPSTAERHHQRPCGRRRATRSSTRPAGSTRSAEPDSGSWASRACRVPK